MWLVSFRYNQAKQENDQLSKELESKREQFKEFERKDIKLREDMKHLGAKKKKTTTKMSKDEEKMKASLSLGCFGGEYCRLLCSLLERS